METNKIQCGQREKINKIKSLLYHVFKKTNKVNKPLEKLIKKTRKRIRLLLSEYKSRHHKDPIDSKQKTREYYKNFIQIHLKT